MPMLQLLTRALEDSRAQVQALTKERQANMEQQIRLLDALGLAGISRPATGAEAAVSQQGMSVGALLAASTNDSSRLMDRAREAVLNLKAELQMKEIEVAGGGWGTRRVQRHATQQPSKIMVCVCNIRLCAAGSPWYALPAARGVVFYVNAEAELRHEEAATQVLIREQEVEVNKHLLEGMRGTVHELQEVQHALQVRMSQSP